MKKSITGYYNMAGVRLLITITGIIIFTISPGIVWGINAENGPATGAVKNSEDFYSPLSPTSGIQEAIDALPPSGGLVVIPPGTYLLKRSIILPDNTALHGSGPATILKKCYGVETKMVENVSLYVAIICLIMALTYTAGITINKVIKDRGV